MKVASVEKMLPEGVAFTDKQLYLRAKRFQDSALSGAAAEPRLK